MTLNIPAGHYQVSFVHEQVNTLKLAVVGLGLHYVGDDFPTDAQMTEAAWATNMMPHITSAWRLSQINWAVQEGTARSTSLNTPGGETDPSSSPQVAWLCRKSTGLPGRKMRGRWYLPGVPETGVNENGALSSIKVTQMQDGINAFLVAISTRKMQPELIHHGSTLPTNLVGISLQTTVATQRRRLR